MKLTIPAPAPCKDYLPFNTPIETIKTLIPIYDLSSKKMLFTPRGRTLPPIPAPRSFESVTTLSSKNQNPTDFATATFYTVAILVVAIACRVLRRPSL